MLQRSPNAEGKGIEKKATENQNKDRNHTWNLQESELVVLKHSLYFCLLSPALTSARLYRGISGDNLAQTLKDIIREEEKEKKWGE